MQPVLVANSDSRPLLSSIYANESCLNCVLVATATATADAAAAAAADDDDDEGDEYRWLHEGAGILP